MAYDIPLFDLNFDKREETAVIKTLRSGWISIGPECAELEKEFADALGAAHAVSLANCTVALHLALLALGVGKGDEVIVPSLTFVATVNAVMYTGAKPVFCDIENMENPVVSAGKMRKLATKKTKAMIVMHYAGNPCDMAPIMKFADSKGIKVVEDACHGPLSEYGGRKIGTIGHVGCFSFFSNKNISSGEGGMAVTNDKKTAEKIRLLRSHGMTTLSYERAKGHSTSYDVVALGYNYRMDDIRASIARVQLKKLPADINRRQAVRRLYLERLLGKPGIIIPFAKNRETSSCYIMPVVLKGAVPAFREKVRKILAKKGIQTSVHYPPVHRFAIYRGFKADLPLTDAFSGAEITLPMYGRLGRKQVIYISDCLLEAAGKAKNA